MIDSSDFRTKRAPLSHGAGYMPVLGFGTLIPDPDVTISATRDALQAGFRHFDCAERYRNEREVGEALQAEFATGGLAREDVFITTKLWNTNHRPERVEPAFDASLARLGISYVDLYLIHTPYAFQPGDNLDPRDQTVISFTTMASLCLRPGGRWKVSLTVESAGRLDYPTSLLKTWCLSTRPRGSNRPWSRSNRIRICLRRSFWSSASRRAWCSWHLRHWVTE